VVEDMCEGACTSVKSMCGEMEGFRVRVLNAPGIGSKPLVLCNKELS